MFQDPRGYLGGGQDFPGYGGGLLGGLGGMGANPKMFGLLGAAANLLQASGPSTTPKNFGSVLGSGLMGGLQGLQQGQRFDLMNQEQQLRNSQMEEMKRKTEEAQAFQGRLSAYEATLPEDQRAAFRANPNEFLKALYERQLKDDQIRIAPPGSNLFRGNATEPFFRVPFNDQPAKSTEPKPIWRQVREGDHMVTEDYINGQWVRRGGPAGNAFAPKNPASQPAAKLPKPPSGFEWADESGSALRPIKGGPKDTSMRDKAKFDATVKKADLVMSKVDEALGQSGRFTTGIPGGVLSRIWSTPAYDLKETLATIKAQIGFNELQAMRDASPTGGALGQVAIQELERLEATLGSLKQEQSEPQFRENLKLVRKHYDNWKKAVMEARQKEVGTEPQGTLTPDEQKELQELQKRFGIK